MDLIVAGVLTLAVAIFFSIRYEPLLGIMMVAGLAWTAFDPHARARPQTAGGDAAPRR